MKSKINIILPVVVALTLPVLGFYSSSFSPVYDDFGIFGRWFSSSIFLFFTWHLLWYISNSNSKYKNWWFFIFPLIIWGIFISLSIIYKDNYQLGPPIRFIFAWILIIVIQYALKTQINVSQLTLEKEQLQTENYKAQLKALQAKIDPHFLFNSLNTLRSMIRQQHSNSEKFVMSLSDFYRQTMKYKENTTILFSEELDVLESYLFVMKNRNEAAISIDLNIKKDLHDYQLPTLALQIVIENCFKHNSMTQKMPLYISIKNTEDDCILVCNNKQPKIGEQEVSGYGLDLLRKRYELLDIQKGVTITENSEHFCVQLKLIKP